MAYSIDLSGRVAFVTGASSGLGAQFARTLASAGAAVVLAGRRLEKLKDLRAIIDSEGGDARVIELDVTDHASIKSAVAHAETEVGSIDILVNVVGGAMPGPFLKGSDRSLTESFDFNVTGPVRLCRAAVPHMLASGGGSIVNITTAMGHLVSRGYSTYGTVKAALDHATRLMAADLSPKIRVNGVAPGAIHTDSLEVIMRNPELRAAIEAATPMRRLGVSEDIAAAVLYLCTPASSYVTGKIIDVDGGIQVPNFQMPFADL